MAGRAATQHCWYGPRSLSENFTNESQYCRYLLVCGRERADTRDLRDPDHLLTQWPPRPIRPGPFVRCMSKKGSRPHAVSPNSAARASEVGPSRPWALGRELCVSNDAVKTCLQDVQLAWLRGRRAIPRELPGAAVGACTRPRRISRATRKALLPVEARRFSFSFHRISASI
jgi:hypothetical protein